MANFDNRITASVVTDAPPVGRAGFGTVIIVAEATFSERIRFYESATEASEDTDLNAFAISAVAAAFAQTNKPSKVAVGRFDPVGDADYSAALDAVVAESTDFYGVTIESRLQADQESAASWALSNERVFLAQSSDADILDAGVTTDVAETLQSNSNDRAAVLYHADDAEHGDVAWMADRLAIDPDSNTATWSYVQLKDVTVDSITSSQKTDALAANANLFIPFYGLNVTGKGTLADGSKLDVRITVDWTLARSRENIAQTLVNAAVSGKIPYTDEGFKRIESAVRDVLNLGEDVGHFVPGTSFVNMPRRSEVTDSDATNRILRFDFGAGLAGAVEEVVVDGTLSVDLDLIENLASG